MYKILTEPDKWNPNGWSFESNDYSKIQSFIDNGSINSLYMIFQDGKLLDTTFGKSKPLTENQLRSMKSLGTKIITNEE